MFAIPVLSLHLILGPGAGARQLLPAGKDVSRTLFSLHIYIVQFFNLTCKNHPRARTCQELINKL